MTTALPPLEVNLCRGNAVITKRAPSGGYVQAPCPGCLGCDRDTVAAVLAPRDPFAALPGRGRFELDEEEW